MKVENYISTLNKERLVHKMKRFAVLVLALTLCSFAAFASEVTFEEPSIDARTMTPAYNCHITCSNGNSATVQANTLQTCLNVCSTLCGRSCQVVK